MNSKWCTLATCFSAYLPLASSDEPTCGGSFTSAPSLLQQRFQKSEGSAILDAGCDGVVADGRCWYMSEVGENCDTTCALHGSKYSYANPSQDITPLLLGSKPDLRQEPWIFVECYVPGENRYHPSNPNAWGVPEKTPANELPEAGKHTYATCALACPCSYDGAPVQTPAPGPSASVQAPILPETPPEISPGPLCNDGLGLDAIGRCWYLSDTGESCDATCQAHGTSYLFAIPEEDMVPKLVGHQPLGKQDPWIFVECYSPREDRYHTVNTEAWGVPAYTPSDELALVGQYSYPTCRLSCPCKKSVPTTTSTTLPILPTTTTTTTIATTPEFVPTTTTTTTTIATTPEFVPTTTTTTTIPTPDPPAVEPYCTDGIGLAVEERCWYLSEAGANCATTCAARNRSYFFAAPSEDMIPRILGRTPSQRQEPWIFLECYVFREDRYHPFNPDAWGVPDHTPPEELGEAALHTYPTCRLACPCTQSLTSDGLVSTTTTTTTTTTTSFLLPDATTTTTTTTYFLVPDEDQQQTCSGIFAAGRCWYLSDLGGSCDETCASHSCSYSFSPPPAGDIVPLLLKKVPYSRENPWLFVECYVPESDIYYPFNRDAWGVPDNILADDAKRVGQYKQEVCQLSCPCQGQCESSVSTATPQTDDSTLCTWQPPAACSPKFEYMGIEYDGCAMWVGHPTPWCSHDRSHSGAWSNCEYVCPSSSA